MSLEILNLRFKSDYKMSYYTLGFDVDIIRMKCFTKGSDHARVHAPSAVSTSKLMLSNSRRLYDEFIYRNRNRTSINTDTILCTTVY